MSEEKDPAQKEPAEVSASEERKVCQTRALTFDLASRATDDETIPVVVSTDAPVEMPDGPEILVHRADAVDLQRAPLPIIATHKSGQINVGIVDGLRVDGGKLRGVAKFGSRAEAAEYRADVLSGIIRSVSAGYRRLNGTVRKDGTLVTTRWMPTHVAMIAEPADIGSGFFRADETRIVVSGENIEVVHTTETVRATSEVPQTQSAQAAKGAVAMSDQDNAAAGASADKQVQVSGGGNMAAEMEQGRIRAIQNLCKSFKITDDYRDMWVGSGQSVEEVSEDIMGIVKLREANNPKVDSRLGLTNREVKQFSFARALMAAATGKWDGAGFELECSRTIYQKTGKPIEPNKFSVPYEIQEMKRDLTVASSSGGGFLVSTANQSFIEMLRNRTVVYQLGVNRLPGLVGSVTIPKQTAAATPVWLANEASTITESAQTFGQLALTPHTVGAYVEISRQLLLQSAPAAEQIAMSDVANVAAIAVDLSVLAGTGGSGQPTGISATGSIGAFTGTSLASPGILDAQSDVLGANVMPVSPGYVTTAAVAALLMARPELPSTGTTRLWQGAMLNGSLFGVRAMVSAQMATATMLFGDWDKCVVGEWGTLEIETNPYANFQAGIIGIRAMITIDVGVRYAGAFSYSSSIT
jgi:HK97 family phage major capsid protein